MTEDKLKIEKFLDLIPDNWLTGTLATISSSNIIHKNDDLLIISYVKYVQNTGMSFVDEKLNNKHTAFFKSICDLKNFLMYEFSVDENNQDFLKTHKYSYSKEDRAKHEDALEKLINDTETKYKKLRQGLENELLNVGVSTSEEGGHFDCKILGGEIFIDGDNTGVTLTPALLELLNKLLIKGKDGSYEAVSTAKLRDKKTDNAFRTSLRRLRKETEDFFDIVPSPPKTGTKGYILHIKK